MREEAVTARPPNSSRRAADQPRRNRAAIDEAKSRKRSPPSRGTRGSAFDIPRRRFIHASQ